MPSSVSGTGTLYRDPRQLQLYKSGSYRSRGGAGHIRIKITNPRVRDSRAEHPIARRSAELAANKNISFAIVAHRYLDRKE
jgi:hypothetical protein